MGDSGGLFLLVQPSGGKLWRLKYRIEGKEKKLGLGTYPEVSLGDARKGRDKARAQIAAGKDPGVGKVRKKAQDRISADNTFATVAAEFINKRIKEGWAENTQAKAEFLLGHLSPAIGRMRPAARCRLNDDCSARVLSLTPSRQARLSG